MKHRAQPRWHRKLLNVITTKEFGATLAFLASLGWLHDVLDGLHAGNANLSARQADNTAEAAEMRADLRELRLELSHCRGQE